MSMFHRHKWTCWTRRQRSMKWSTKFGIVDCFENYQWRECTTCGKYREEVIG